MVRLGRLAPRVQALKSFRVNIHRKQPPARTRGRRGLQRRDDAWLAARGRCYICGVIVEPNSGEYGFELDHIVPLSEGGADDDSNLGVACIRCHRRKTAEESRERSRNRYPGGE